MRQLVLGALALLVITALTAGAWAWQTYQRALSRPLLALGEEDMTLQLDRGTSFAELVDELVERGLIKHAWPIRVYARYSGDAARIQAGEYRIDPGTTAPELITAMVRGDVIRHTFTIVEGWRFRDLLASVRAEDALEQTLNGAGAKTVMARLDHPDVHAEGRFLPETYHFTRGTTDLALLRRAYDAMARVLKEEWAARADGLPLANSKAALTLASIIEKETAIADERSRIAGVFVRRLRRGMRLQTDPTVIYGLGDAYDGNLRRRDLRRDTPYNTYTRDGLPPTPIALPGRASIHAALHPADGDSLYFVASGDGGHVFSATLKAHNQAVRRYQLGDGDE